MKSSIFVLVFFAMCAVSFATSINHHRNANGITEYAKKTIDSSARALKSAIDKFIPLAKNGFNIGGEVYLRFLNGPSKEGRAYDAKLARRLADFGREARSAIYDTARGIFNINPFSNNEIQLPPVFGNGDSKPEEASGDANLQ